MCSIHSICFMLVSMTNKVFAASVTKIVLTKMQSWRKSGKQFFQNAKVASITLK